MKTAFLGLAVVCVGLTLLSSVSGDVYMQNPRGSNNRLNDKNENAQNQNRLFDSQNNANGGHQACPTPMTFYADSILHFQWNNQHGGGAHQGWNHNNIVIQIMCDDNIRDGDLGGGANSRQTPDPNDVAGNANKGLHESEQYYLDCLARPRNKGLFIADQNLDDTIGATSTRQNAGGTRYGMECPEERDYYPYWEKTPWRDVAILTSNTTQCTYYETESENVKGRGTNAAHGIAAPICDETPWQRINHNGNTNSYPRSANNPYYNFTLANSAVLDTDCVLRLRYNISTDDYDAWATDSASNGNNSPVTNDPQIDVGYGTKLQLALNTAQTGRTFQDRTHVMRVTATPTELQSKTILNVNVQGRRGNNQQNYPAQEYDFVPARAVISPGSYIHFQWAGSDYNDPNAAGEGTAGTDRSNIIQIKGNKQAANYPALLSEVTMFGSGSDASAKAILYAMQDQTDPTLNDADPYFDGGTVEFPTAGSWHYLCTRNNNFTNRSQKGSIVVDTGSPLAGGAGVAVAVGASILAVAATAGGLAFYARAHPTSSIGQAFAKRSLAGAGGSVGSRSGPSGNFSQATGMTRSRGSRDGSRGGSRGSRKSSKSGKSRKSNASKGSKGTAFTGATAFTRAQR